MSEFIFTPHPIFWALMAGIWIGVGFSNHNRWLERRFDKEGFGG